jgi:hypothetical protein
MEQVTDHRPRRGRPTPADGVPVIEDIFTRIFDSPENRWSVERWLIAPGDAEPDQAVRACLVLEEHLVTSLHRDDLQACFRTPVTAHYYTKLGEQHGKSYFEALVYSPLLGWIAVEPAGPQHLPARYTERRPISAWCGHHLADVLADQHGRRVLPELTRHLQPTTRISAHLSDLLRARLATVAGR